MAKRRKKCETPGCKNLTYAEYRTIKNVEYFSQRKLCITCTSRKNRAKNELVTTFHSAKSKAKHRGIKWTLTIEDWKEFCDKYDYLRLRGKGAHDLTIDRIKPELGYVKGNIQALPHWQNDVKGQVEKRARKGWGNKVKVNREKEDPF